MPAGVLAARGARGRAGLAVVATVLHMAVTRSRREHLQRIAGDRGTVAEFVDHPDVMHRAIGWYLMPVEEIAGCACEFCVAARDGREVFLAGGSFVAAALLHTYATEHPGGVGEVPVPATPPVLG
jgi:hypothetical protein